jgi:hypothetical protein
MWILPKQLHTLAFVPDTEALNLDLNESSQLCAQSLFVRSKPSSLRTWSQKWKRDSWTQHLYGRILKPSRGTSFVAVWTSSLEVTLANHSAAPENDLEPKTQDICGLLLQTELGEWLPEYVSSKTSRDTSRWDSPQSSVIWKNWITQCRGEYSARLKLALLTEESECSSWPTVTASENSYRLGGNSQASKCLSAMARRGEMSGLAVPASNNTHGSRLESWATPQAQDTGRSQEAYKAATDKRGGKMFKSLKIQVESWATPNALDGQRPTETIQEWEIRNAKKKVENPNLGTLHKPLTVQVSGKLNPRWVETLMNLPVGWTMPSCVSPVIPT